MLLYDPEKDTAIQYASDKGFRFGEAYRTMQRMHELKKCVDFYTNDDYEKLESLDLRTVRYQKQELDSDQFEFNLGIGDNVAFSSESHLHVIKQTQDLEM